MKIGHLVEHADSGIVNARDREQNCVQADREQKEKQERIYL